MSVETAVLPIAGIGTRMTPITKAVPKELLPLPVRYGGRIAVIPVIHAVLSKLYGAGIRHLVIVSSPKKTAIERYLSRDEDLLNTLYREGKTGEADILEDLHRILDEMDIEMAYQDTPRGFGPAVYLAREYVDGDFIIHTGDDYILDRDRKNYISRLIKIATEHQAPISTYVEKVEDPRHYGVIMGKEIDTGIYLISDIVEKPRNPPSNLAVIAIYRVPIEVFSYMARYEEKGRKWELVDPIRDMIREWAMGIAIEIDSDDRVDVGRPTTYIDGFTRMAREILG